MDEAFAFLAGISAVVAAVSFGVWWATGFTNDNARGTFIASLICAFVFVALRKAVEG